MSAKQFYQHIQPNYQPNTSETFSSYFNKESSELALVIDKFILTNFKDVSILKIASHRKVPSLRLLSAIAVELMQNGEKVVFINGTKLGKELDSSSEVLKQQIALSSYLFIDQLQINRENQEVQKEFQSIIYDHINNGKKLIYTCSLNKKPLDFLLQQDLPNQMYSLEIELVEKIATRTRKDQLVLNTTKNKELDLLKIHMEILSKKKKQILLNLQKNKIIRQQAYEKAAECRENEKVVLTSLMELHDKLIVYFNSLEIIPGNYKTLQQIKNILLEFNTIDTDFKEKFAESIKIIQNELQLKYDNLKTLRKKNLDKNEVLVAREIYLEMIEIKNRLDENFRDNLK